MVKVQISFVQRKTKKGFSIYGRVTINNRGYQDFSTKLIVDNKNLLINNTIKIPSRVTEDQKTRYQKINKLLSDYQNQVDQLTNYFVENEVEITPELIINGLKDKSGVKSKLGIKSLTLMDAWEIFKKSTVYNNAKISHQERVIPREHVGTINGYKSKWGKLLDYFIFQDIKTNGTKEDYENFLNKYQTDWKKWRSFEIIKEKTTMREIVARKTLLLNLNEKFAYQYYEWLQEQHQQSYDQTFSLVKTLSETILVWIKANPDIKVEVGQFLKLQNFSFPNAFRRKKHKRKSRCLTNEERLKWLAYIPTDENLKFAHKAFLWQLSTGQNYVDLEKFDPAINISTKKQRNEQTGKIEEIQYFSYDRGKNNNSSASIPLSKEQVDLIKWFAENKLSKSSRIRKKNYNFFNIGSSRLYQNNLNLICKELGIEGRINPKDARTSFGQFEIDEGTPAEDVSAMLAHSNPATIGHYVKLPKKEVNRTRKIQNQVKNLENLLDQKIDRIDELEDLVAKLQKELVQQKGLKAMNQ